MVVVTWSMKDLANCLKKRQLNEFSADIAVDGPRGNGKSTFIYKLFCMMGNFRPRADIVFSRTDVMNGLKNKKYGLIFADEMINSAHNREFYAGDQLQLIKMLNMYRDNYNLLAGAVPFFYDLDPQVRKFIKMRITVVERGLAVVQFSKPSLYSNDPWDTDHNKKIERSWEKSMKKGKVRKQRFERLTTFSGYIKFGPLQRRQQALYKEIKEMKRKELVDNPEGEKPGSSPYDKLYSLLMDHRLTMDMLTSYCYVNGKSYDTVKTALQNRLKSNMVESTLGSLLKKGEKPKVSVTTQIDNKKPLKPILI